ncbi:MAG TPA: hypothetical protein VGJ01_10930 [Pseudolabrys sp.]|jgi:hypothetical protein
MKKLLIGTAFLAMLATPALAQSFDPDFGTGNVNPPAASLYGGQSYDSQGLTEQRLYSRGHRGYASGNGAYAYVPDGSAQPQWSGRHSYIHREDSNYPVYR